MEGNKWGQQSVSLYFLFVKHNEDGPVWSLCPSIHVTKGNTNDAARSLLRFTALGSVTMNIVWVSMKAWHVHSTVAFYPQ